jgi:hypothetical protein
MAAKSAKPKGKWGGRPKGALNKRTIAARNIEITALREGLTPLDVMLHAMYDAYDRSQNTRLRAGVRQLAMVEAAGFAKDAAPYIHPKLVSNRISNEDEQPFRIEGFESVAKALNGLAQAKMKEVSSGNGGAP